MKKKISKLNYDIDQKILSPLDFNVPQTRDRLYIVAKQNKLDDFVWPIKIKQKNDLKKFLISKPKNNRKLTDKKNTIIETWKKFLKKIPKRTYMPNPIWSMEFGATYPFKKSTPYGLGLKKLRKYKGSFGKNLIRYLY